MKYTDLEIVIPVYNEGEKIIKLMDEFTDNVKTNFKVLLCYDLDSDNLFEHIDKFKKYNFDINLIKNPSQGPLSAIKHGLSRALTKIDPNTKDVLKKNGFLTRDSRTVERKKYGRQKARRSFQFSKR